MTFYGIISRAKTFQHPQLSLRGPGLLDAGENVGRARISMWRSHDEGGKRQETKFQLVSEFFWDHLLTLNLFLSREILLYYGYVGVVRDSANL